MNDVPLESYVEAVMSPEASDLREPEALTAMGIVIRNYTLAENERHQKDGFDFCDLTHCQVYKGLDLLTEKRRHLVTAHAGTVLVFDDKIIRPYYHACCGGQTVNAGEVWVKTVYPYLLSVSDRDPPTEWRGKDLRTLKSLNIIIPAPNWVSHTKSIFYRVCANNQRKEDPMGQGRAKQKAGQKSRRKVRYSLEERHRLGISATAKAAAKRAEKLARQKGLTQ